MKLFDFSNPFITLNIITGNIEMFQQFTACRICPSCQIRLVHKIYCFVFLAEILFIKHFDRTSAPDS
uniref:Uncharacterized protein n=1 Tax=Oryza brachyantha TaxID=4533 RepID=J3L512_ORYBR